MTAIGILGVGTYLPPDVRTNAWWPADVVAGWTAARAAARAATSAAPPPALTDGQALVRRAMGAHADDPFQGAVTRHVLPADGSVVDMEVAAAEAALARAGVDRRDVDLLLTYAAVPDYLINNAACVLHQRLGLGRGCLPLQLEATAFSFLAQLQLAEAWMARGAARYALLVQSAALSRIIQPADPYSPLFGDGAAAVVLGPVDAGRGVIKSIHRADTAHPFMLVASPPGRRWYDDGRAYLHSLDLPGAQQVFLAIADEAKEAVDAVLAGTGHRVDDVAFFASHQGTPWVRAVSQQHAGLQRARTVDVFPQTGSLFAANIPFVLHAAEARGQLAPGDLVILFGGGTGVVFGATLLRWGRA